MRFGQALEQKMKEQDESQIELAKFLNVSNSLISKIANGSRRPAKDTMRTAVQHYDDPELALAAANEVTAGAFIPWLDNADLHRANVSMKSLEEITEALEAIGDAPITKRSDQLSPMDREKIRSAIVESIEAMTALYHQVAILCRDYGFSFIGMLKEHRADLKAHNYIK